MLASAPVGALRVANEAFLVSSTIERCPKTMMIRELVVNAIEAAREAGDDKRVEISSVTIEGAPKLSIRNTGRGLSAAELDRICDLASSLYKQNSLDANFGMGAKVASLPSNKHGMRYRSCKDGVVSEVILCQRDGVYGRLRRGEANAGESAEIIDATDACRAETGYNLGSDWTEVVLFGNAPAQNTVRDPYAGNPRVEPDWLLKNLVLRFFRLPPDVTVQVAAEIAGGGASWRVQTLAASVSPDGRADMVRTPSGVIIHYRHHPSGKSLAAQGAEIGGLGCIVYKNEIYDPRTEGRWMLDAPAYGIPFGAKFCSIFVELPDDYLVRPEAYRQFLRFRGGDQRQVFLQDFAQLVSAYLPGWLKFIIRGYGPQQANFLNEIADELRDLVRELGIEPEFTPPKPLSVVAPKASPADTSPRERQANHPIPPPAPVSRKFERPPEIIGLDDDDLINERGLKGRAAKFYPSSHQLFINLKYPAVTALAGALEVQFHAIADAELRREEAQSTAGWAVTRRIARALIYSLSKKAAGWPAEDVKRAQSPESFSLVADDWVSIMEPACQRMAAVLGADDARSANAASFTPILPAKVA